ncbi:MAG: MBL fold metallo-hydrolase [Chloroflexi bacterium]|nr:MBL fold metallo-hydrolase [Chloroflexota bacterium]
MVEEILPNLYKNTVPLPNNPLQALNSYIIKGRNRNLMIDTGMNREECWAAQTAALKELNIDLNKTDFFITHLHADHLGLVGRLFTDTSAIYFNKPDALAAISDTAWRRNGPFAIKNGFPEEECKTALNNHPGRKYSTKGYMPYTTVVDGDIVNIGDYSFRCVQTPGHTRGHMCLYESSKKLLLSGDHILIDITPNISLWSDDENPLEEYLCSLDKTSKLDVELVLPGHRSSFKNCRERIDQLKHHHEVRANEVLRILEKGDLTAFQIASLMTWDMSYKYWEEFPPHQKWFAFGEAVSHLKYLMEKQKVEKRANGQGVLFSLRQPLNS